MSDQTTQTGLELSKVSINLELTKAGYNYQKLLQDAEKIEFREDTLEQDYEPVKVLKKMKTALENIENPHTAAWKKWNEDRKSLVDPLDKIITRKGKEFTIVNEAVILKNKKKKDEETRKANIKTAIGNFTLNYSTKIASAITNEQLIALQKLIGSEKSRSGFYQEFLPDLFKAVEGLEEAAKKQKEHIRELTVIQEQKKEAEAAGDDEKLLDLLEKETTVGDRIEETRTGVQEQAINQNTAYEIPEAEEVLPTAVKASRKTWEWKIVDLQLLQKKRPDLVELVPIKARIDAIVKERRDNKTLTAVTEDGLEIYQKEHF